MKKGAISMVAAAALLVLAGCGEKKAETPSAPDAAKVQAEAAAASAAQAKAEEAKAQDALKLGVEAVVYGLPLVIMDITREKVTNVAKPEGFAAPVNQFVHVRSFPDASFKDVVRANVDTLYSSAFLDLSAEPLVLSVPDTQGRYYLMPLMDAWTNIFASPGKRTTGTKPGHFAITGPGWTGELPKGVTELKSPTNMVWLIGRTQTNGPKDYAAVHKVQDGYKLVPLSAFGKPYAATGGPGRPERRHEDAAGRAAAEDEQRGLLQPTGRAPEKQPAAGRRSAAAGQAQGHRHRARREVRPGQAGAGDGQGAGAGRSPWPWKSCWPRRRRAARRSTAGACRRWCWATSAPTTARAPWWR